MQVLFSRSGSSSFRFMFDGFRVMARFEKLLAAGGDGPEIACGRHKMEIFDL